MPQREFWTAQIPTRVVFTFAIDPTTDEVQSQATVKVEDQSGAVMVWTGGALPVGYAPWAFSDAVKAAMEAFEGSTPEDTRRAFSRTLAQWRKDAQLIASR